MTNYRNVKSSVCPDAIRFDEKSVWVAENIKEVEVEIEGKVYAEYEFDQTRYSKDEYIKLLDEKNTELNYLMNTILGVSE